MGEDEEKRAGASSCRSSLTDEEEQQPQPVMRATFCLKNKERLTEMEETEDCFILDFDPYFNPYFNESLNPSSPSLSQLVDDDAVLLDINISVIAERGQEVACRDFPHSRHQCMKFPFPKTPHYKHCKLCYCYVCDVAAPCADWLEHCHAIDTYASPWWHLRRERRGQDFLTLIQDSWTSRICIQMKSQTC